MSKKGDEDEKVKVELVQKDAVITLLKAQKNEVEMQGMRNCNIRDCAALMKYFGWLKKELADPNHTIDEYTGA